MNLDMEYQYINKKSSHYQELEKIDMYINKSSDYRKMTMEVEGS